MDVVVVGQGKLAAELLAHLAPFGHQVRRWGGPHSADGATAVVHAGSGRELPAVHAFCAAHATPLVELATGLPLPAGAPGFALVHCANANVLVLKFMALMRRGADLFAGADIRLLESHQAGKSTVPGTALDIAASLGIPRDAIVSVRAPEAQQALGIAPAHRDRHALHRVTVQDGPCTLSFEARVEGEAPYAAGVDRIVRAVQAHALERRVYDIAEFVERGWL